MTSDLTFTVLRLGYLALIWLLVLWAVHTLRRDIFGTVVTPRGKGRKDADSRRKKSMKERREARKQGTDASVTSLLVTGGPLVGTLLPLGATPVVIGRSPASTLVLEDEYASAQHARLLPDQDGNWWIEDMGSRNGTTVDDERLTAPRYVKAGDIIRIGQTTLELVR